MSEEIKKELNRQIHEKVMGLCLHDWDVVSGKCRKCGVDDAPGIRHYCGDIAAAWRVVEKMREKGFDWVVGSNWSANSDKPLEVYCTIGNDARSFTGISDNPAEAICLAVLGAIK